jgi:hypothetical protein
MPNTALGGQEGRHLVSHVQPDVSSCAAESSRCIISLTSKSLRSRHICGVVVGSSSCWMSSRERIAEAGMRVPG